MVVAGPADPVRAVAGPDVSVELRERAACGHPKKGERERRAQ